jgi:hypothetical protein
MSVLEDKTATLSRSIRHQPLSDEGPNREGGRGEKKDMSGALSSVITVQCCTEVPMFQTKLLSPSWSKMEVSHHSKKWSSWFVNADEQRYSSAAPQCVWRAVTSERCMLALCCVCLNLLLFQSHTLQLRGNSFTYSQLLRFIIILSSDEITTVLSQF